MELFGDNHSKMKKYISGFSLGDDEILTTIRTCRNMNNYVLDPHGAIGYQALVKNLKPNERGIFLETAHPVKFLDVVNKALQEPVNFDEKLLGFFDREEVYQIVTNDFPSFKEQLIS